jgi:AcrR family transcriptional regulator
VPRINKRSYVSPARREKAEATRTGIIEAASGLFLEKGYRGATTAEIAQRAGISEASVFSVFGSKAELLLEVVTDHVKRHSDFPLSDNPAFRSVVSDSQMLATVIEELARVVRRAHDRSWRLLAVAAVAGQEDAVVGAAVARGADRRRTDCEWLVREVAGVSDDEVDTKTDEVWTLISVENYRHLVIERNWQPVRYEAWLAKMLAAALR